MDEEGVGVMNVIVERVLKSQHIPNYNVSQEESWRKVQGSPSNVDKPNLEGKLKTSYGERKALLLSK